MYEIIDADAKVLSAAGITRAQWAALEQILYSLRGLRVEEAQALLMLAKNALPWLSFAPDFMDKERILDLLRDGVKFV